MPSESYPRDRSHSRSRDRSRSGSPERRIQLPSGASPISESDYFLKSDEFRIWLKDEKRKYFDELTSDKARRYFRKFVKAWNSGKLPKSLYAGVDPSQAASSHTAYRWSFTSKASRAEADALRAAREEVGSATYNRPSHTDARASRGARLQGPTLPSASDMTLARETADEARAAERDYQRKRDKREQKERVEEVVGPKPLGREGMLEKKRTQRESDREFRERGDEGLELDESTLLGGGDSFKDRIAKRDAARKRFEEKKFGGRDERLSAARERADTIRQKDKATMDMFMQLAKNKFG
ncbi:hypothetical protein SCP_0102440 [Sparassis crispa]|uniref:Splicing arginine serine-rich 12 n=1 Tax=Sparassis crispa TaxID=139825 RepID=A0A401G5D2_9APHY|nr:hypothetical protein SCP_0102440 [Sparassis crispa]GBE77371.1 hypothetical protein SCP_0102440 [Sparassis crispa]